MALSAAEKRLARARADELNITGSKVSIFEIDAADDFNLTLERPVKITRPGWMLGRDIFFAPEILERDAPLFVAGTQLFLDHPLRSHEMHERPEGSVRDLIGVLSDPGSWDGDGPDGPGIYATAQFLPHWADFVEAVAPYTGLSLRVLALWHEGEVEGQTGRLVDAIVAVTSVDLVTKPALDGKIMEAAASVRSLIAEIEGGEGQGEGQIEQQQIGQIAASNAETDKETQVSEEKIKAAEDATKAAEADAEAARKEADDAKVKAAEADDARARAEQALACRAAHDLAMTELAEIKLPDAAKTRIAEAIAANPPMADGKLDDEKVKASVTERAKSEEEYLTAATGFAPPKVTGAGDAGESQPSTVDLQAAFRDLGLDEDAAKIAARVS